MHGGALIREARRRAGLSQTELARRLGTKQPVVARWENGDRAPSFHSVVRAIRACGLDLAVHLVAPDDEVDAVLSRWSQMTPRQRLERNEDMLRSEDAAGVRSPRRRRSPEHARR